MITLLAKLFIKPDCKDKRQAYGVLCGITGILFNLLLFAFKLAAGTLSGSIAITADAFNNLSDSGSSVITLLGFKLAGQKPDRDHPFGHGRFEYLSGLFVAIAIIVMGFELLKTSVEKLINPQPVEFSMLGIAVLGVSILVKLYMWRYNKKIGKHINSAAMQATASDSISDVCATSAVFISTLIGYFANINVDAYFGLLVAIVITIGGFKAAKATISPLLGQPPTPDMVGEIANLVMAHEAIIGLHDLVVHDYGPGRQMISLHAEVPCNAEMIATHDEIDLIERELEDRFNCDAVIHMDPIANDDENVSALREQVAQLVYDIDKSMTIHDFRIVAGPTHTNLIFDVVAPYEIKVLHEKLEEEVCEKVSQMNGNFFAVVKIDSSYVL